MWSIWPVRSIRRAYRSSGIIRVRFWFITWLIWINLNWSISIPTFVFRIWFWLVWCVWVRSVVFIIRFTRVIWVIWFIVTTNRL